MLIFCSTWIFVIAVVMGEYELNKNYIGLGGNFFVFCLFKATPAAYGSSQARGRIRAIAASLHHSHSNARSLTHGARPGIEPSSSWILVDFISAEPQWELPPLLFFFFFFSFLDFMALKFIF